MCNSVLFIVVKIKETSSGWIWIPIHFPPDPLPFLAASPPSCSNLLDSPSSAWMPRSPPRCRCLPGRKNLD